jgi:UDP-sugar pyrophosphorylase
MAEESWPEVLRANAKLLSKAEKELAMTLLQLDQQHLFALWDAPGTNDDLKHAFFEQAGILNSSYGASKEGLKSYVSRARVLLESSKAGDNPFEGYTPSVPSGVNLEPLTPEYSHYEQKGMDDIGKCGFVLVAGGLGERLGYNGIKISLPVETVTKTCYLEYYCQQILAMQREYAPEGHLMPLAIMVSDDTNDKTVALLEENAYFGMNKSQVTIMKQGKVPALTSNAGEIALASTYVIDAKPHGHGDVHSLMYSTGTAQKWADMGVKWVNFFQDTNALALFTLPAMLGVSLELELEVNSLAIIRKAKQAVGAIVALKHSGSGKDMTINVEYNQLDPLLRSTTSPEGDVNDPATGCSPFPGNINQLLIAIGPYLKNLRESKGMMPEFVNPKYADAAKEKFKKPTRLECMMQDYPKLLPQGAKVGFTSAPAWLCYSPCKNNSTDAAQAAKDGIPAASAYTSECDSYFVFAELLRRLGASIPPAEEQAMLGISASPGPRVVFHPSFAVFPHEVAARFMDDASKVSLSSTSTLILKGDVQVQRLALDGSLSVAAEPGARICVKAETVSNAGHVMEPLDSADMAAYEEVDRMRGYQIKCKQMKTFVSNESEELVFNGNGLVEMALYEDEETSATNTCKPHCNDICSIM